MMVHVGSFAARDAGGAQHVVEAFTDYMSASGPGGARLVEGRTLLRTSEGLEVLRRRKGEYLIVPTGVALRSADPDAP
jgi:hypothetical protein